MCAVACVRACVRACVCVCVRSGVCAVVEVFFKYFQYINEVFSGEQEK